MRKGRLGLLLVSISLRAMPAVWPEVQACGQADEAITLIENARADRADGYFYRAEAQYQKALAMVEQAYGVQSVDLIPALNGLAELYFDARRYVEAEALSRRSAALVESSLGTGHPLMATALHDLAAIYQVQGQYAKAEPLYERALTIRQTVLGPMHPFVAATLINMAEMESAMGLYDRAAQHYGRAVEIREAVWGMQDPRVAETLSRYAAVLRKNRRKQEAALAEARSRAILAHVAHRGPASVL